MGSDIIFAGPTPIMIDTSTLKFIKSLSKQNNKEWMDAHRTEFTGAKDDFEKFIGSLIEKIVGFDPSIGELTAKDCIYRQNRDVRFSADKSPYKQHMGASIAIGGKKSLFAGYYFHLEPGNKSMVGGGLWMPPAENLKKVRQEIDYCSEEFRAVLGKDFIKQFGDLDTFDKLVNVPKGYDKDSPVAEYLKLKSFVATHPLPDSALHSPQLIKECVTALKALQPLVRFINRALE